jgi:small subunit ribosomal protein S1
MSTPSTPIRGEELREQEGLNPAEPESSFGDILNQFEQSHAHEAKGEPGIDATVVAVTADTAFFDVGQKVEAVMPLDSLRDERGPIPVKPGDVVRVAIAGRNAEGYIELSLIRVERPKDWSGLQKSFDEKQTISGTVIQVIKGGLAVDIGVRAFMPASRSGARDVPEMQTLVGQEVACRIIKLDTDNEDVVVDRRAVLEEERAKAKEAAFNQFEAGAVLEGTVRSLLDYGAFIDIGGFDGMLHVADISHGRVNKPADALAVGQKLQVKILKVDPIRRRISLGLKQLQADPWSAAAEKYHVGDRVKGRVARVTDFGAFVELEPGLDGLVHLSEMSWSRRIRKPADAVKAGDMVEVQILSVSPGEKRISLGMKQVLGDPWDEIEKRFPPETIVEGSITQLKQFGAFMSVTEDVEGMIHVGDITHEKRINHPQDVLKVGQIVKAVVLENDKEKRRLRLGLKQLIPTSLDEYIAEHKEGDVVTGRVAAVKGNRVTADLGEGVQATFSTAAPEAKQEQKVSGPVDVSALSTMLSSKWKGGGTAAAEPAAPKRDVPREGEVRNFRIVKLDAEKKKLEIEFAS